MKKIRMIEFDGADGVGKGTQINEFKKYLKGLDKDIYQTKLLGGDGTCDYQKAYRQILLHSKFPTDSVEFEEQCFAETDLEGIRMAYNHLKENDNAVCIKDRSLASHVVYALAKNMSYNKVKEVHHEVIRQNILMNRDFGSVHVLLVPDKVEWLIKRIKARAEADGIEVIDRLENLDTQTRVVDALRMFNTMDVTDGLNIEIVEVFEHDTILNVKDKILKALKGKYEF